MKINLADYHPILDIQENTLFTSNGNIVVCFRTILPEIYSLADKDFEEIHNTWFQAFKYLPIGTIIHKQDIYQKTTFKGTQLPKNTFLQKATFNHFKGRDYILHNSYMFFVLPLHKTANPTKYVNPFTKVIKEISQKLSDQVFSFKRAVQEAVSFINNSRKFALLPINQDDIIAHTHSYFNGFNHDFDTDIQLTKGICVGNHHFDVLAVNSELCFGDALQTSKINDLFTTDSFSFHQGFLDGLGLSLNENHIVNHIIYMDDKLKWRKLLEKRIEELSKSVHFGTQNKVLLSKLKKIVERINLDESSRIIRGHLNILFGVQIQSTCQVLLPKLTLSLKN